jgi:hypothetical protein
LAERFENHGDDLNDDFAMSSAPVENPFNATIAYGGEILDSDGHQVLFSAGEVPVDDSANDVWRSLRNLEYHDHTTFADMTPMMADLFDKTDDCTVSEAVRAMEAMGKLDICIPNKI